MPHGELKASSEPRQGARIEIEATVGGLIVTAYEPEKGDGPYRPGKKRVFTDREKAHAFVGKHLFGGK